MSGEPEDEAVPSGVCTAPECKCGTFKPHPEHPMYCAKKNCGHSVEWHHLAAREVQVEKDSP